MTAGPYGGARCPEARDRAPRLDRAGPAPSRAGPARARERGGSPGTPSGAHPREGRRAAGHPAARSSPAGPPERPEIRGMVRRPPGRSTPGRHGRPSRAAERRSAPRKAG